MAPCFFTMYKVSSQYSTTPSVAFPTKICYTEFVGDLYALPQRMNFLIHMHDLTILKKDTI